MSDFDVLDKWIDINAPNLNKGVLHTQVASIAGEEGGTSIMIVTITDTSESYVLSKTWQEIYDYFSAGGIVILQYSGKTEEQAYGGLFMVTIVTFDESTETKGYEVVCSSNSSMLPSSFSCDNPNEAPMNYYL